MNENVIYLNNAATSFPKPESVYDAVDRTQREFGAPGRGSGLPIDTVIRKLRRDLAEFIGGGDGSIVFTFNGTDALNTAIRGAVRPGDHVVTTATEHNSVLRPLRWLEEAYGVRVTRVPCDAVGRVAVESVLEAVSSETKLVVLNHASNVTGTIQPIEAICEKLRRLPNGRDVLILLDAAQSLGHVPIDVEAWQIDMLASPGHKGLLGPLGTGFLYLRPGIKDRIVPLRFGGTGTHSDEDRQPTTLPDRYESGTLNAPGLAGLAAGLDYVQKRGPDAIESHERRLTARFLEGVATIAGVSVVGPTDTTDRTAVVSVVVQGYGPDEVAGLLSSHFRIAVRSGVHCAPLIHPFLGTDKAGTVRFSFGPFNDDEQIDAAVEALRQIAGHAP
ncbi:MAG: aminotransferase class V-fold PLP-dependent enzyme [Planctomycetota bacterium]|nr:MAG: aminotransferase class V-fold PLP-dependent enzyme [Planctomycetota bacterium]